MQAKGKSLRLAAGLAAGLIWFCGAPSSALAEKYYLWPDQNGVLQLSREKPADPTAKAQEMDASNILEVNPGNIDEANKIGSSVWRGQGGAKAQPKTQARSGQAKGAQNGPLGKPGGKGGYVGYNIDTGEMVNITPDGKGGYNLRNLDTGQKFEVSPKY